MIHCTKCKHIHDLRVLRKEDKIFEGAIQAVGPISILANVVYEKAGFNYIAPEGLDEASTGGPLIIIRCPACIQQDSQEREDNDLTTT